jgi:N-acetylmuramoyl-L-alanine amidase
MRLLAAELKPKKYDLIIELHFNAANKSAQGCETVSYPGNTFTQKLGEDFCKRISEKYCIRNRGVKIGEDGGRGWGFLSLMPAPAIILEPFFGDQKDCIKFENEAVYADVIKQWLK